MLGRAARARRAVRSRADPRGRVFAIEYLGTNQIVTIDIERGQIKARLSARTAATARRDRRRRFPGATSSSSSMRRPAARSQRALSRAATLADIALAACRQALRRDRSGQGPFADGRQRRIRGPAGPVRRGQDDDAPPGRRARASRSRRRHHRRSRRHPRAAGGARRRLRFSAILALPASDASTTISPSRCARRRGACPKLEIRKRVEEIAEQLHISEQARQSRDAVSRAARCSASRSAAPWCASRRSI